MNGKLPLTEELDFHYLLALMTPLQGVPEFSWLPELFSIVGYERLITLCKYAGGESIKIPTLAQLVSCLEALQWFYDVQIACRCKKSEVPKEYIGLYDKIEKVYNVEDYKRSH